MNFTPLSHNYTAYDGNTSTGTIEHCELYPSEAIKCDVLLYSKRVSGVLSVLGAVITLSIILAFKKYKIFYQRLIGNLTLAALLFAISFLMSDFSGKSKQICVLQGAFMTYTGWTIMLSVMVISLNLYSVVQTGNDLKRWEKILTLCCWAVPTLPTGLPFLGDVYGPAGVWCWMRNDWRWRFGIWYIWNGISEVLFFAVMGRVVYTLRRKRKERISNTSQCMKATIYKDIKTIRLYPVVYFVVNLFPTIDRIYNAATGNDGQTGYQFPLLLLQTLTDPLLGAIVAVVFALDRETCRALTQKGAIHSVRRKWSSKNDVREFPQMYGINDKSTTVAGETGV